MNMQKVDNEWSLETWIGRLKQGFHNLKFLPFVVQSILHLRHTKILYAF
jgi:hypothetical protein